MMDTGRPARAVLSNSRSPVSDRWVLIRSARQLLTLHGPSSPRRGPQLSELAIIPDGSVLIKNGIIQAVGPSRRLENLAEARHAEEIDASGKVLMPAFIDPHAYLVPRRVPQREEDPAARRSGINSMVRALPATRLSAQADQRLKLMARHGTATVGALSGYGFDETGELKILRAFATRNQQPLDVVSIVHWIGDGSPPARGLLNITARRKLAAIASVRFSEGGCSLESAMAVLQSARAAGLKLHLENWRQCDDALIEMVLLARVQSLVTVDPPRAGLATLLAQSGVVITLTPDTRWTKDEASAVQCLIESGATIALGSGMNPETGGTASMQSAIRRAVDCDAMSIEQGIACATVNAAYALGQGEQTGTLEYGKRADLAMLDVSDYREIQYVTGANLTHSLIKRGVVLFEEDFPGWPPKD